MFIQNTPTCTRSLAPCTLLMGAVDRVVPATCTWRATNTETSKLAILCRRCTVCACLTMLSRNNNKYCIFLCVRARLCVYPGVWACAYTYVHVALFMQHASPMRRIVTPCVAPQSAPHFSTLSHKRHDFRKKSFNIKYVFWFSLQRSNTTFLILSRIYRDIAIDVKTSSCKVPIILVGFKSNLNFLGWLSKKSSNIESHQNPSVGAELLHADGRTDMTNLIIAFRNFANAPKNSTLCLHSTEMCFVRILEQTDESKPHPPILFLFISI